jgi:hypothetical protein
MATQILTLSDDAQRALSSELGQVKGAFAFLYYEIMSSQVESIKALFSNYDLTMSAASLNRSRPG